jgi:hypothetical protein
MGTRSPSRVLPVPDAAAFESPALLEKHDARRNSRGELPQCPDTPLRSAGGLPRVVGRSDGLSPRACRKTPNGKTRELNDSQVLFAGPLSFDVDPDSPVSPAMGVLTPNKGSRTDQFEFMGLLGAGAFGEVFKALVRACAGVAPRLAGQGAGRIF